MTQELLKDVIYRRIREMIIMGALPMGSKLSEAVLSTKLNATKAPVRDALKRLNSEGLVQIKPKSGSFVFSFSDSDLAEFLQFRYFIESKGIELAFKHNSRQLVQELSLILDRMMICIDTASSMEYLRLDDQFHQTIISLCGNRYFKESYSVIAPKMATARNRMGTDEEHMQRSFDQHRAIIDALQNSELVKAQQILTEHILPEHGAYWGAITQPIPR